MTPSSTGGSRKQADETEKLRKKRRGNSFHYSLDGIVKSIRYTPGYIYLLAFILALPATWLTVGRSGEDVPGMIAMVVTIVFFGIFTVALSSFRRRLQNRRSTNETSSDDLG